jgi:hypothetical protein
MRVSCSSMQSNSLSCVIAAVALTLCFTTPLSAQISFDVGPLVAYYRPIGNFDPASVYTTDLPNKPSDLSAMALGSAAHVWFGQRWGAGAQVAVANSSVPEMATPNGPRGPTAAQEMTASVQAQYDISPNPEKFRVWVSAGPGVIRHAGKAYERYGSPVDVAGVVGIDITVPIASRLRFAAGVTTLLYPFDVPMPANLSLNPGSLEHGFQTDALLHVGLRLVAP